MSERSEGVRKSRADLVFYLYFSLLTLSVWVPSMSEIVKWDTRMRAQEV